ncbi:MAG: ferredoxin [Acidimicrobiia bacterium]
MKVTVDRSRCTGHGRCYVLVPEVFSADDDGYSVVLEQEVPAELESRAQLGEANCPERAITCERT